MCFLVVSSPWIGRCHVFCPWVYLNFCYFPPTSWLDLFLSSWAPYALNPWWGLIPWVLKVSLSNLNWIWCLSLFPLHIFIKAISLKMDHIISPLDCQWIQVLGHCKNTSLLVYLGLPALDSYISPIPSNGPERNPWLTGPSSDNCVGAVKWWEDGG